MHTHTHARTHAHTHARTHARTHKHTHTRASTSGIFTEGIQLQFETLMIPGRHKLHKSTPPLPLHPHTWSSTVHTHTHTHTYPIPPTLRYYLQQVCIIYAWNELRHSSVTTEIRWNSFLGPLTVCQSLSADHQISSRGHRGSGLMKKSLFSIKRLITPEKHELWYEFVTDDEELKDNRKRSAPCWNHSGWRTFNLIIISFIPGCVLRKALFFVNSAQSLA